MTTVNDAPRSDRFVPAKWLEGAHPMTLYTWARPRNFPHLPTPRPRYFDVASDARVLAHCYWQPASRQCPTLLALHGLEGSSQAHYMQGLADKAHARGFNAVLLNQRNCGGTEHLSHGLYHSGLSADPAAVIRELIDLDGLREIIVVGYSLGGNVGLRLAGTYGIDPPPEVRALCAVSPTVDLALCVEALEQSGNAFYEWNFVRNLKRRMRRKARLLPGRFDLGLLTRVHTVRGFDELLTAPHHGFRDADDYYYQASSLRVIDRISLPTLILIADNDPFVPAKQFLDPALLGNPCIRVIVTHGGGHCGFFSTPANGFDGYWAEHTAVAFAKQHV